LGDKTQCMLTVIGKYYYMVMNPVDWIQTVWIQPDPDFAGS